MQNMSFHLHSRPQSLRSFWPAAGNESSGSNHFEITKEITEFCPWFHCAVCFYGACLKWLLPELSFSDRWSRGTKTLGTSVEKLSGPKRSIKITDHFTCTSAIVIYCITCTLCKKLYVSETGRRLGDRFREHLLDVEKDDINAFKPVARQFNLPNHSKQHRVVCGLSLHQ